MHSCAVRGCKGKIFPECNYLGSCKNQEYQWAAKTRPQDFTLVFLQRFPTRQDLQRAEEILVDRDYINRQDTWNLQVGGVGLGYQKDCGQCSNSINAHLTNCPLFTPKSCPECGGIRSGHYVHCPKYMPRDSCDECGAIKSHLKKCSKRIVSNACSECHIRRGHLQNCSHRKPPKPCEFCAGIYGHHAVDCQNFKPRTPCSECGTKSKHKPNCGNKPLSQ